MIAPTRSDGRQDAPRAGNPPRKVGEGFPGEGSGVSGSGTILTFGGQQHRSVYWGEGKSIGKNRWAQQGSTFTPGGVAAITDSGARGQEYLNFDRQDIYNRLLAAGVITSRTGLQSERIEELWKQAQAESSMRFERDGTRMNPFEIIKSWGARGGAGAGGGGGGGSQAFSGTRTSTATSTTLNLSSAREARALLDTALANELGREATAKERAEFLKALNAEERANPATSRSTTTTTYKAGQAVSSHTSTTSEDGFSATDGAMMARERAREHEEWETYQQNTTYMDAFLSALASPQGTN